MKLIKPVLALICAFIILCVVFIPLYYMPARLENPLANTKFVWDSGAVWMQTDEGISWGKADEWGFNNPAVDLSPDILLLGSSHTEAFNVLPDENTARQLEKLFGGGMSVYNMGMSGHDLPEVIHYLPNSLKAFEETPRIVIIELRSLTFTRADMEFVLREAVVEDAPAQGIAKMLKDLPFAGMLKRQMDKGLGDILLPARSAGAAEAEDDAIYAELMAHIADIIDGSGVQIVFVYHRPGNIEKDGAMYFKPNPNQAAFEQACAEHGFIFVDMAEPFARMYSEENLLPYGFVTGATNSGHLNANGHRAIAQTLYAMIREWEE